MYFENGPGALIPSGLLISFPIHTHSDLSNLTQRILTAVIGVPLIVGITYLGSWYFGVLVIILCVGAQAEFYAFLKAAGVQPRRAGLVIGAVLSAHALTPWAVPLAALLMLCFIAWSAFTSAEQPLLSLAGTLAGVIYPTALLSMLINLRLARGPEVGSWEAFLITVTVFVLVWATDIMAYVVGKSIGKHPLAPLISPKKTWEGAIGGAVGAVLAAAVLKLLLLPFLAWPHVIVLALLCGVFSQLGDLAESRMKRSVGVKDSGTFLPGHGGFLDRFDALILAAPSVYLYLQFVAGVI